jgi:hypothetical protein
VSAGKRRVAKPVPPIPNEVPDEAPTAIEAERWRLFQAHAIVSVSAAAVADEMIDPETVATALECAAKIIDSVASVLERFTAVSNVDPLSLRRSQ